MGGTRQSSDGKKNEAVKKASAKIETEKKTAEKSSASNSSKTASAAKSTKTGKSFSEKPQKKISNVKKKASSGGKKRAKKTKKPKVVLSTRKVITLCACICCFCALFLGLSVVLNSVQNAEKGGTQKIAAENSGKKSAEKKLESEKISSKSSFVAKAETEKSEAKSVSQQKSPVKNSSEKSNSAKSSTVSVSENQKKSGQISSDKKDAASAKTVAKSSQNQANPSAAKTSQVKTETSNLSKKQNQLSSQKSSALPAQKTMEKSISEQKNSSSKSVSSSSQKSSAQKLGSTQANQKVSQAASVNQKISQRSSSNQKIPAADNSIQKKAASVPESQKKSTQVASVSSSSQNDNAQNQALKNPRFDIPKAVNGATIVIVIDDAGRSVENVKKYASLPFPLTIAVLPRLEHSRDCAQVSISLGKEVILHQPMQSVNHNLDPGPGKITVDMSFSEIADVISGNLASLGPGVKGMNNHEGSEVTGDVIRIGAVLDACQKHGIYFLDSRTTAATKAPQAALERDMRIYEKAGPYLDNDLTREKMTERMYETLRYANNHGRAVVIGHVDKSVKILPDLLAEMYPYMKAAGYRFATPSTLR